MKRKKKLHFLISAGPTREPIDPVRFISNYSTGLLGYAIAQEASKRKHQVILVSGPTQLAKPKQVGLIKVASAGQMQQALAKKFAWCNCLIMTAAVADFRAATVAKHKIKRTNHGLILRLLPTTDILSGLARRKGRKFVVGCSLDTENLTQQAQAKLRAKNLDLIVATRMDTRSYPFGLARIDALLMDKTGTLLRLKRATKRQLARILLDSIERAIL